MISFICNIYFPADAVEVDNRITEVLSESTEIPAANQTLDESFKTINSHDMSALESEILQLDNSESNAALNKSETSKLFQDSNEDEEIGESQLMALCSGAFVTQHPENVSHIKYCVKRKISFDYLCSADGAKYQSIDPVQ